MKNKDIKIVVGVEGSLWLPWAWAAAVCGGRGHREVNRELGVAVALAMTLPVALVVLVGESDEGVLRRRRQWRRPWWSKREFFVASLGVGSGGVWWCSG